MIFAILLIKAISHRNHFVLPNPPKSKNYNSAKGLKSVPRVSPPTPGPGAFAGCPGDGTVVSKECHQWGPEVDLGEKTCNG